MSDIISKRAITVGRVTLTICHRADYDDGYSYATEYLGKYSDYREPRKAGEYLIHRDSERVLDCNGIWRDSKGRIVADPRHDWPESSRHYNYVWNNNTDRGKYALRDAARLEAFERWDWYYLGITATVTLDGAEIGDASVWGVESDSGNTYLAQMGREVALEALHEARQWMQRNGLNSKAPRGWRVAG